MIIKTKIFIFVTISIHLVLVTSHSSTKCNRSCGSGGDGTQPAKHVPYPFGFSPTCHIHLNCSPNGDILIGEFPIQTVTPDSIIINVDAKCDRPVHTLSDIFGKNYAPTTSNGLLLQNCSSKQSSCTLPATETVQTNFESLGCNSTSNNVSCYSVNIPNGFLSYKNVTMRKCQYLLSSISVRSINSSEVSLEVQVIQLRWWLEGNCSKCSDGANCTQIVSPFNGNEGFRCQCNKGLVGDGYRHGVGCRKGMFWTSCCRKWWCCSLNMLYMLNDKH